MVVVVLNGGLGNQMFQFAFGRYLSTLFKKPLFLDNSRYAKCNANRSYDLDIFKINDITLGSVNDIFSKFSDHRIIKERFFNYDDELVKYVNDIRSTMESKNVLCLVYGYWQSFKYLMPIENIIRKDFIIKAERRKKILILEHEIRTKESVMINVRRGDYLQKLNYHGVVSKKYIEDSIVLMSKQLNNPYFFVFSDDIDWCRSNIRNSSNVFFVDESYYDRKYKSYFMLMSSCKHFIISNSTFCWWAAWLSDNSNKKIIAPRKWFATKALNSIDLTPSSWICM